MLSMLMVTHQWQCKCFSIIIFDYKESTECNSKISYQKRMHYYCVVASFLKLLFDSSVEPECVYICVIHAKNVCNMNPSEARITELWAANRIEFGHCRWNKEQNELPGWRTRIFERKLFKTGLGYISLQHNFIQIRECIVAVSWPTWQCFSLFLEYCSFYALLDY